MRKAINTRGLLFVYGRAAAKSGPKFRLSERKEVEAPLKRIINAAQCSGIDGRNVSTRYTLPRAIALDRADRARSIVNDSRRLENRTSLGELAPTLDREDSQNDAPRKLKRDNARDNGARGTGSSFPLSLLFPFVSCLMLGESSSGEQ